MHDELEANTQGTFYRSAKECYDRGVPVIPIPTKEKGTNLKDWQNLASTDPAQLNKWKKTNPQGNAGAVCKSDGICVVDWDEPSLIATLPQPLPSTFTVKSSKGQHSYFRQTDATRALGNKNVSDPADPKHHLFDFQQHNKYVVAAHSIHPSGAVYTPIDESPIVDCPDWLVEWMKKKAEKHTQSPEPKLQPVQPKSKTGAIISKFGSQVTKAQFENWLTLHDESFVDEPTYDAALARWQYIRAGRCPWEDEHGNKNADKDFVVYFSDDGKPGIKCVHSHAKQWSDYRDFLIERTGSNFSMKTGKVSESEPQKQPKQEKNKLCIGEFSRPRIFGKDNDYVINPLQGEDDGWFPRSDSSLCGGSSGSGKSTLMIDLLVKQRNKELVFGHTTNGLPFLVLMADRGEFAHNRTLRRMKLNPTVVLTKRIRGQGQAALLSIKEAVESCPEIPPVVFIEGLDMMVEDASKMAVVAPFIDELLELARWYHIALISSVGSPKMSKKDFYTVKRDQIFGSVAWSRKSETIIVIGYEEDDDTDAHRCACVLLRNGPAEKFDLIFEHGKLVTDIKPFECNDPAGWIMQTTGWFSVQDVCDATDEGEKTVRKKLKAMCKAGILHPPQQTGEQHKLMYIKNSVKKALEEAGGGAQ